MLISYIPQYLDNHAIEYIFKQAKLSLLLKILENEDSSTLDLDESILPSLDNNIYMGNSMIPAIICQSGTRKGVLIMANNNITNKYNKIILNENTEYTSKKKLFEGI